MQFKNTQVFNFEGAFYGMRNPMNSWDKSDSFFGILNIEYPQDNYQEIIDRWIENELQLDNREIEMYSKEWEDLWEEYSNWIYKNGCLQRTNDDCLLMAAIGPNDLKLAQRLVLAGDEHAKFMRQIFVSVDIEAPIYW